MVQDVEELLRPIGAPALQWAVVCPPISDIEDGGKNRNALGVAITDGVEIIELCRIGLVRRNTKNKGVAFEVQLQTEIDKANEIVATVNEHLQYLDELRQEAAAYTRKHVAGIIGAPSSVPV